MKSYREIADSVFARRDQYVIAQRKKKQAITRVTASVGSVALVSLVGIALFQNDAFHETPAIAKPTTTTVTHSPVTEGTATTTAPSATIGGVESTASDPQPTQTEPTSSQADPTATQTQPTVTQSKPTATQSKPTATTITEPSKTMTPTTPEKVVITGQEYDSYGDGLFDAGLMDIPSDDSLISRYLQNEMKEHKYEDVVYGVVVEVCPTQKIYKEMWVSVEELAQIDKQYQDVRKAFEDEAKMMNPSWNGRYVSDLEVWTDTMRANYERWQTLAAERTDLEEQHRNAYYERVLEQRFEELVAFYGEEPPAVSMRAIPQERLCFYSYYLELTAEQIDTLAERGGYVFCLAEPLDKLLGTMEWEELW